MATIEELLGALNEGITGGVVNAGAGLNTLTAFLEAQRNSSDFAPTESTTSAGPPSGAATIQNPSSMGGVSTSQLSLGAGGGGGIDVAFGSDLLFQMTDLILRANADRRASIDQTLNIATYLTDLERTSPTRAARLATNLGMESGIDFSFLNALGAGQRLAPASGGRIGSTAFPGVSLPQALSGRDLSFLSANPNVANVVRDFAESVGLPDIFSRSQAGLIPTSGLLTSLAA